VPRTDDKIRSVSTRRYRADLDGIRAVAVLAVVLFHLELPQFAGGYVGVDVFFVLSGFLITGIIAPAAAEGRFSFGDFYLRRIRRLLPAVVATVIATTLAAAIILQPIDMIAYGRFAIGSLFSFSNVIAYSESGYWDTASDFKPLLHTWSLGVEEQFYLVWPALIVGLVALRRRIPLGVSLALITVAGAAVTVWFTGVDASAAFYLSPFRVFQFAAGAAIGCMRLDGLRAAASPVLRDAVLLVGLGLVLVTVATYDDKTVFPGWAAVPVTAGAALLVLAGSSKHGVGPVGRALLGNPGAVWLGRVSYSMYLVHWPVVSLYRYRTGAELSVLEQIGLGAITLLGTVALYYGVERRFYRRDTAGARTGARAGAPSDAHGARVVRRTVAVALASALVLGSAWAQGGWAWRFGEVILSAAAIDDGMRDRFTLTREGCLVSQLDDPERCPMNAPSRILVLGNSHEPDGYNFLVGAFGATDVDLISFGTTNNCEEIVREDDGSFTSPTPGCQVRLDAMFARAGDFTDVLYAANIPFAPNKAVFVELLAALRSANPDLRVLTLGGYLNLDVPCSRVVNETGDADDCASPEHVVYFEDDPATQPLRADIMAVTDVFIDRIELLCPGRVLSACKTEAADGTPMAFDEHHNSLEFALETGRLFAATHPDVFGSASLNQEE
jgi:peptidoglycan/LPS O-acetylase OafA/YrhL